MSVEAINWALEMPGTPTQKHVLLVLANYANDEGHAFPSIASICRSTGLSDRAVRNARSALLENGIIEKCTRVTRNGVRLVLELDAAELEPRSTKPAPRSKKTEPRAAQKQPAPRSYTPAPRAKKMAPNAGPHNHHITTINHQYPNGAKNAARSGEIIPFSASGARSPERRQARSARGELFSTGLGIVRSLTGKPDGAARGLLGKWAKTCRDDIATLNAILREAADINPIDPIAWIEGAVKHRFTNGWGQIERDIGFDGRPDLDALAAAVGDR